MAYEVADEKNRDFTNNWVNSSRFLFYLQLAILVCFLLSTCASLYTHRYKGKPDVEVQGSSEYTPKYK